MTSISLPACMHVCHMCTAGNAFSEYPISDAKLARPMMHWIVELSNSLSDLLVHCVRWDSVLSVLTALGQSYSFITLLHQRSPSHLRPPPCRLLLQTSSSSSSFAPLQVLLRKITLRVSSCPIWRASTCVCELQASRSSIRAS